jgi:peptidoglycan hydrolase-like protein with peptidoglycan-binding domain
MSRRPGRIAIMAVTFVVAMLGLAAAPASASTPQCTTSTYHPGEGLMPATSSDATNCWMARGNYSDGVYVLQEALVHCYHLYVGSHGPDSDFGGNTVTALKTVQRIHGISVDGGYGPQTRSVMHFWLGVDYGDACS